MIWRLFLLTLLVWSCRFPGNVNTVPDISAEDLESHIRILADDRLEGRLAGSDQDILAAKYIEAQMVRFGLQMPESGYIQDFPFISGTKPGPDNQVRIITEKPFLLNEDQYAVMGFSSSGKANATLVFTGYGISAPDDGYDDYANLEVDGKVVIILRYSPAGRYQDSHLDRFAPLRTKAKTAKELGAAGVIFVTGPQDSDPDDPLVSFEHLSGLNEIGIPVIHVHQQVIEDILAAEDLPNLDDLQDQIRGNDDFQPQSIILTSSVEITTDLETIWKTTHNISGFLPGSGELADEWIVIGAHYDHLGWGGPGSPSMDKGTHAIHNGADDNASGVAGMLELAEYFQNFPPSGDHRSIVFTAFGAEELGLLGSNHFINDPPLPLEQVKTMINMDMIGGLHENVLIVGGSGTSSWWEPLLQEVNEQHLDFSFDTEGYGASDHQPFYLQDIPVLFFFTGAHGRYHRPTDDVEYLNFTGLVQVTQLVQRTTEQILTRLEPPDFVKTESAKPVHGRGYKLTIGVIPDFTYQGDGFRISAVREMAPAGQAGLQDGDIIIRFNDIEVLNIHDYMFGLESVTEGESVPVVVQRGAKTLTFQVIPSKRE